MFLLCGPWGPMGCLWWLLCWTMVPPKSSDGAPGASRATYANRQRHQKKTKRERILFWGFFLVPWSGHRTPWELFGSFFVQNMCRQKPSIGPEAPRGLMATPPAPPKTMVNFSGGENSTSEEKRAWYLHNFEISARPLGHRKLHFKNVVSHSFRPPGLPQTPQDPRHSLD